MNDVDLDVMLSVRDETHDVVSSLDPRMYHFSLIHVD